MCVITKEGKMKKLMKMLLALAIAASFQFAFAGGAAETCKSIQPISNFDYSQFKLQSHKNEYTKWFTYLTDSMLFDYISEDKTHARFIGIDLVLLDGNKAVIHFNETNANSENGGCWVHYEEVFYGSFETEYIVEDDKLYIDGFGVGQAILCDGTPALALTYSMNVGPSAIAQKTYIITYGRSNISPVESIPTLF